MSDARLWLLEDRRLGTQRLAQAVRRLGYRPEKVVDDPAALIKSLSARLPAIAVVDLSHTKRDRLWTVRTLADRFPQVRTLVVASGAAPRLRRQLKLLGAGEVYVEEPSHTASLGRALSRLKGRRHTPRRAVRSVDSELPGLTGREREVLGQIGLGADNLKISALLGISERTVKAHVTSLFKKLGAENRVELALAARAAS
jgi:DNA-binding NarL/FixJ family response regulator